MAQTHSERLRNKVYNRLLRSGVTGLTDEEISDALKVSGDVLRPRRNELVAANLVVDSGYRRGTWRGRTAKVWLTTRVAEQLAH